MKKLLIGFFLINISLFSETLTLKLIKEIPSDLKDMKYELSSIKRNNYILGGSLIGVSIITISYDKEIREFIQSNKNETIDTLADITRKMGEFYPIGIILGAGYVFENEKAVKTGIYSLEASVLSSIITITGKNIFSRARPYTDEGSNSWWNESFNSNYASFPSGHTTVAFATATTIASMYSENKYIPTISYTLAALGGISRIYDNKHWASDVILGGTIGYITARSLIYIKSKKSDAYVIPFGTRNQYGIKLFGKF